MFEIDLHHDSKTTAVNKLFNNIQHCRVDLACMRGTTETFPIDSDTVKAAEALAREIQETAKKNNSINK